MKIFALFLCLGTAACSPLSPSDPRSVTDDCVVDTANSFGTYILQSGDEAYRSAVAVDFAIRGHEAGTLKTFISDLAVNCYESYGGQCPDKWDIVHNVARNEDEYREELGYSLPAGTCAAWVASNKGDLVDFLSAISQNQYLYGGK